MTEKTTRSTRVVRKPLSQRGPQAISGDKNPDYEYRFVNDTGSRIHNFQQAGYELVTDENLVVGDSRVSDASNLGSAHRVVGDGGTVSVLMRIKKEWFDEDQAKKAAHVDEQEQAMKQNASKEFTGSIKIS